jgi:hypothetical protein
MKDKIKHGALLFQKLGKWLLATKRNYNRNNRNHEFFSPQPAAPALTSLDPWFAGSGKFFNKTSSASIFSCRTDISRKKDSPMARLMQNQPTWLLYS